MISNLLELVGLALLCFGISLVSLPAALIVAGAALVALGMATDGLRVVLRPRRQGDDGPAVL